MSEKRHTTRRLALAAILTVLAGTLVLGGSATAMTDSRAGATSAATIAAADPVHINFTLEGCRNTGTITLPDGSGKFICPDAAYTTGNLGKGWNELDLVPHRVTLQATSGNETYSFIVAGDYKNGSLTGTGWDVISDLVLNTAKSAASCTAATMGAQTITPSGSGVGGADHAGAGGRHGVCAVGDRAARGAGRPAHRPLPARAQLPPWSGSGAQPAEPPRSTPPRASSRK